MVGIRRPRMNPHGREHGSMRSSEGVETHCSKYPRGYQGRRVGGLGWEVLGIRSFPTEHRTRGRIGCVTQPERAALSSDLHERNGPRFMP